MSNQVFAAPNQRFGNTYYNFQIGTVGAFVNSSYTVQICRTDKTINIHLPAFVTTAVATAAITSVNPLPIYFRPVTGDSPHYANIVVKIDDTNNFVPIGIASLSSAGVLVIHPTSSIGAFSIGASIGISEQVISFVI